MNDLIEKMVDELYEHFDLKIEFIPKDTKNKKFNEYSKSLEYIYEYDRKKEIRQILERHMKPSGDVDAIVKTIKIQERGDTNPRGTTIDEVKLRGILEHHLKPSEEEPTTMTEVMIKAEEKIRKFRHDILYNKGITEIGGKLYEFKEVAQPSEDKLEEICKHKSDGMVYTSMPPKRRCKKCGKFYR